MTETIRKHKFCSTADEQFCYRCGTLLVEKTVSSHFDPETGKRIEEFIKVCPRSVEKSFLWWKWQELCGYTTEPPEM